MILILIMDFPVILVAGASGTGKTTWIQQQGLNSSIAYCSLGSDGIAIDATYLTTEMSSINVFSDLTELLSLRVPVYLEVSAQLDLDSLTIPLGHFQKLAIVAPNTNDTEWHRWADRIVVGIQAAKGSQIWRSNLSGQVLDPASLDTLWDELIEGAYGTIQRAKGIFEVVDGRAFHFNYVQGHETNYTELNVARSFKGRPDRFSGIEVVGEAFDQTAIKQTLQDCCLADDALAYYQHQIRQSLEIPA
ncbi:GTP-binding protein [Leptolyngbya boryana CZ1]|uniref:GTP-binding protein n=1 Tax=Leptolyngbya boryana CZ1 TaxID=3060204 RepID=A0AA97AQL0_LEPBY|nr:MULTISPECIES: GTP-binding protein [Leptolyngbya]MBN8560500.1 GTP-binding protein [Leptolyngbya sp. UWPOB_LEPTO1]WNZ47768.1 GTP-binding protein [Leptolyngbya boryana CZ1]